MTVISSPLNFGDIKLESKHGDKLHLRSMQGQEDLGRPFEFKLQLWSTESIPLKDTLGSTMAITMPLDFMKERNFHGHVVSFNEAGHSDGYQHYTAVLRPWFWLLNYNTNSRIFQEQSVLDIAKTIFNERGFSDFKFSLSQDSYRKYEYSVQYRESDFKYLSRLLEQEGIYYYFEHEKDKNTLVLADSPESHKGDQDKGEVEYRPWSRGNAVGRPHLDHWQVAMRVTPGAYVMDDYDFERPKASLVSTLASPQAHEHADAEVFDYPGEYVKSEEGDALVRVRLQALQSQFERVWARGNTRDLGAGYTFKLTNHPNDDQNAEYLVLGGQYDIDAGAPENQADVSPSYHCTLEVCKKDIPFRPAPATPRPIISGYQTAKVVGRAGDEIYTDKYGRVKVQFPWDRLGESNEKSSCWIRVAQVWAGSGMGSMHVPRVGHEVLISFLEGDPDRPLIVGRVYNGNAMPPWALPDKGMISGTKSESTPGGGGFNEIHMDDTKGKERIYTHAQYDQDTVVENDKTLMVHNNRACTIDHEDLEKVGGNQTVKITKNQTTEIEGSKHLTVHKMQIESVSLFKNSLVKGAYSVEVGAEHNTTVALAKTVEVGGAYAVTVGAAAVEKVMGTKTVSVNKSISETCKESITIKATKDYSLDAGENIAITGKKKGVIEIADELTIKVGSATLTMKKNGDILLNGKNFDLNGKGNITMKASKISQN